MIVGASALLLVMIVCVFAQPSHATTLDKLPTATYEEFRRLAKDPEVVVINAAYVEPLVLIAPSDVAAESNGITQQQSDDFFSSLIPARETRVVLYCYGTFFPARRIPATDIVGSMLKAQGYHNITVLEKIYEREDLADQVSGNNTSPAFLIRDRDIVPRTTPLPKPMADYLASYYERLKSKNAPDAKGQ